MISDEAVEAAHNAIIGGTEESGPDFAFDTLTRKQVEAILESAAPYMLVECWEQAYDDGFSDRNYGAGRRDNPYRSQA